MLVVAGFITFIYLNFDEIVEKQKAAVAQAEARSQGTGGVLISFGLMPPFRSPTSPNNAPSFYQNNIHVVNASVVRGDGPDVQAEQSRVIGDAQR